VHKVQQGKFSTRTVSYPKLGRHVLTPNFDRSPMAASREYKLVGIKKALKFPMEVQWCVA
jgi:hypothetical protein